jgi:hypothetical protein
VTQVIFSKGWIEYYGITYLQNPEAIILLARELKSTINKKF